MSKLVKWGLLAVLAIAVIIKVSLWLSVRSIMNDTAARLSPIMEVSYEGITSSLDGRVGLTGLDVKIPAIGDRIKVEQAELKFKSLLELLRFRESLGQGKVPEQLAMAFKGIKLDIHGPLMEVLSQQPAERSIYTAMSQVACGDSTSIDADDLLNMGYRSLESDAEFSYTYQPAAQSLIFSLTADARGMGRYKVSMGLANMSDKPGDLRVNPPRLSTITVEVDDNEYQRKVHAYCAAKMGQDEKTYLDTAVGKLDASLKSQRVALDDKVLQAMKAYYQDPRSLRLELRPTEGVHWNGLEFFDAADVIDMLRPVLLINQQAVDVSFAWFNPSTGNPVEEENALVPAAIVEQNARGPQYDFVPVSSLSSHAGKRLQFITYDGAYYQGILHKVQGNKVFLTVQFGSGSAEMFLSLNKIDKVRVLR